MKRKIFAGVLVLTLLALPGCAAEDGTGPLQSREPDIISCGEAPPEIASRFSQSAVENPDGIGFDFSQPAFEPAHEVRAVSVQYTPVPLDVKTITVFVNNPTDEEMTFGEDYWLEKQDEDGRWEKLAYLPDAAWHDIGLVIQPHSTGKHEISPVYFYGEDALQSGHYRYGNQFDGETLYAEFDFVEHGGESLPRSDEENVRQELKNALGGLQKKGPEDPHSMPEPSKYVQQIN